MARPRKLSDTEMINIVDSFFESNGNPAMLKCSLLEEYAVSLDINVKAYDFRRSTAVRQRMEELRNAVTTNEVGCIAYKNMDVDAFLNRNRTREMLRNSLLELDETWRRIYEKSADLARKNTSLLSEVFLKKNIIETLTSEKENATTTIKELERSKNALLLENRYLKRMLKQHLYPAIANEILKQENVLEQVDTVVAQTAMDKMTDAAVPVSFSGATSSDRQMLSQEEELLNRMRNQIHGGEDGA